MPNNEQDGKVKEGAECCTEDENCSPPALSMSGSSGSRSSLSAIVLSQNADGQPHFILSQNTLTAFVETLKEDTGVQILSHQPTNLRDKQITGTQLTTSPFTQLADPPFRPSTNCSLPIANPVALPVISEDLATAAAIFQGAPHYLPYSPNVPLPVASPQLFYQNVLTQQLVHDAPAVVTPPSCPVPSVDSGCPRLILVGPTVSPMATTDIPNCTQFAGQCGFEMLFPKSKETESKSSVSYTYSESLKKLYAKPHESCPINFKCASSAAVPPGSVLRAMVVYAKPQSSADIVRRCNNHAMEDSHFARLHFVRIQHNQCHYAEDPVTGRHSVTVPWEAPAEEMGITPLLFQFMCYNSCTGTINRRPLLLIVTLENNTVVLGRQTVALRTCACPGRDKDADEKHADPNKKKRRRGSDHISSSRAGASNEASPTGKVARFSPGKQRSVDTRPSSTAPSTSTIHSDDDDDDNTVYLLEIRGRKAYTLLKTIYEYQRDAQKYRRLASGACSPNK